MNDNNQWAKKVAAKIREHEERIRILEAAMSHGGYRPPEVQTTERTGKQWKALMLASFGLACFSMFLFMIGMALPSDGFLMFGVLGGTAGVGSLIIARILAWWFHG